LAGKYRYLLSNHHLFFQVYNEIAKVLEEGAEKYDDGSFGPVLVRLAWHASGYD
jgi:catalase (peroxidase I)